MANSETYIWDVRTKSVEWEHVPTAPGGVGGICIYGPKGALFTLARDAGGGTTVQQFVLYPPQLLASVHQPGPVAVAGPPSPPASIEDKFAQQQQKKKTRKGDSLEIVHFVPDSRPDDYPAAAQAPAPPAESILVYGTLDHRADSGGLGISNMLHHEQRPASVSSRSSTGSAAHSQRERNPSVSSRGSASGGVRANDYYSSPATTVSPPTPGAGSRKGSTGSLPGHNEMAAAPVSAPPAAQQQMASGRKPSVGSAAPSAPEPPASPAAALASDSMTATPLPPQIQTARRQHPLRQEMHPSPDTPVLAVHPASPPQAAAAAVAEVSDIFANLRSRMAALTAECPRSSPAPAGARLADDELRREMLLAVFGWRGDIEVLIGDECLSLAPMARRPKLTEQIQWIRSTPARSMHLCCACG